MKYRISSSVLACLGALAGTLHADVLLGNASDLELNEGNILQTPATGPTIRAGASGSAPVGGRNGLFVFQLPDFGAISTPFLSADLGLYIASLSGTPNYNVDLYGLGTQSTPTLTLGSGVLSTPRYYEGNAVDSSATLIQQDFTLSGATAGVFKNTNATGDTNLLTFLNTMYASGTGANQYVVFRITPDADLGNSAFIGFNYSSADAGTSATIAGAGTAFDPVITYTAVPEPTSFFLLGSSLGALAFLRRRRA